MVANDIINIDSLDYTFYRNPGQPISIIQRSTNTPVGVIAEDNLSYEVILFNDASAESETITNKCAADFLAFKSGRPEYTVLSKTWLRNKVAQYRSAAQLSEDTLADMKETYITVLQGCAILRSQRNGITDLGKINTRVLHILSWLDGTDFYRAPASTKYHEPLPGGLLLHTLTVCARIIELAEATPYNNTVSLENAVFCALVHDWCKINKYELYMRNQKNEVTQKWEQVPSYKYREDIMVPLGHGETSMYLAMKMFSVSQEEAVAIRNHMGKWAADNSYNITDLQYANENYPLCLLLQFADQLSCVKF